MEKSKKVIIKKDGVVIGTTGVNTCSKSATYGYAGQDAGSGRYHIYQYPYGICRVELDKNEVGTIHIVEIVKSLEQIAKEILDEFKNKKKLAVMYEAEKGAYIETVEVPVNKRTIDTVLRTLTLNTVPKPKYYTVGVCIRDTNDTIETLQSIGKVVMRFPTSEYLEVIDFFKGKMTGANNGNFAEYFLSGKIADIEDRFRDKKVDVYVKLDEWKAVRRWELKTSFCTVNKGKKSGASNTNTFAKMQIMK